MGSPFRSRWLVRSAVAAVLLAGTVVAVVLVAADDNAAEEAVADTAPDSDEPEPDQAEAPPVAPAEPPAAVPEPQCDSACKDEIAAAQERNNTTTTLPRVPDVHGMTPADAEAVLARTGLTVRNIAEREVPDEHVGVIVDQSPTPGIESRTGEVRLILGIPTTTTTASPTTHAPAPTGPVKVDATTPTLAPEHTDDADHHSADTDPPSTPVAPQEGQVRYSGKIKYTKTKVTPLGEGSWWVCERVEYPPEAEVEPYEYCGPQTTH